MSKLLETLLSLSLAIVIFIAFIALFELSTEYFHVFTVALVVPTVYNNYF
ncbi:MAG: hypothetical protein ACRC0G_06085 [Fusobacteriaceae bacterium]